jgi:malonyl CoA-acyl carrier protein transacylase
MNTMPTTTALLFPGQGSHSEGMHEPFADHPLIKRGIELLGFDPFDSLAEGTRSQQPALFLCSMAQWASRNDGEADPFAAAGHSLGEYAALTASGAIDFEDGVRLVRARAQAMADAAALQPGGMVAMLGGERDAIFELAVELDLSLANDNAPGQIVLSGVMTGVDAAVERAAEIGCRARKLAVAGAFHSPLMAPAADALRQALDETPIQEPAFPVLSNGSTRPFEDIRSELAENLLKPVRWREILFELQGMGATDYVECGPGAVLRGLVKRTLGPARPEREGRPSR